METENLDLKSKEELIQLIQHMGSIIRLLDNDNEFLEYWTND